MRNPPLPAVVVIRAVCCRHDPVNRHRPINPASSQSRRLKAGLNDRHRRSSAAAKIPATAALTLIPHRRNFTEGTPVKRRRRRREQLFQAFAMLDVLPRDERVLVVSANVAEIGSRNGAKGTFMAFASAS